MTGWVPVREQSAPHLMVEDGEFQIFVSRVSLVFGDIGILVVLAMISVMTSQSSARERYQIVVKTKR
jgi:hypothetical protein